MSNNRAVVNFVDTHPGMGKTDGAVRLMAECVRVCKEVCVYASPTIALIDEVEMRLAETLGQKKHPSVIRVDSDTIRTGQPLHEYLVALLDGRESKNKKNNGATTNRVPPGTVILTTHKTFMDLQRDIVRRGEVTVIFDEAYRCVFNPIEIKLSGKEADLFRAHMDIEDSSSDYRRINKVSSVDTIRDELRKLERKPNAVQLFELLDSVRKETSEVYVSITGEGASRFEFQEVKIPSRMFDGWKCVYLMSAYLKTTQLWALLTRNYFVLNGEVLHTTHGTLRDASDWVVRKPRKHVPPDSMLVKVVLTDVTESFIPHYKKRLKQFERRYRDATIFCLTDAPLLSRNLLNSVLVDADTYDAKQQELRTLITKLKAGKHQIMVGGAPLRLSRSELIRYAHAAPGTHRLSAQTKELVAWYKSLTVAARSPYRWYLLHALDVALAWLKQHEYLVKVKKITIAGKTYPHVEEQKPLVLLNNAERDKVMKRADLLERMVLLPFECAGMNSYRDHQVVVFLAALNATPAHTRFYREKLPWYDPKQDYAVASAVQAITRGALRKNDSKDKVLIITADSEMARLLKARLLDAPRIVHGWDYKIPKVRPLEFSLSYSTGKERMNKLMLDPAYAEKRRAAVRDTSLKHYKVSEAQVRKASPFYAQLNRLNQKLRYRRQASLHAELSREEQAELGAMAETVLDLRAKHRAWAREYRKSLKTQSTHP